MGLWLDLVCCVLGGSLASGEGGAIDPELGVKFP